MNSIEDDTDDIQIKIRAILLKREKDLPLVYSNALDLIKVKGGVNKTESAVLNAENKALAGVSPDQLNVQRDGVTVNDVRYAAGMNSPTKLNPETVGQIKLAVAPVDADA